MRINRTAVVMLGSTMVVGLAGCSSPSTSPAAKSQAVTITFQEQFTDAQTKAMEPLVSRFETENAGIKVILNRNNDAATYYTKLVTQITAGSGPDIARVEPPKASQYVAAGWVVPIGDATGDPAGYFPAAAEPVMKGGQLYGVPFEVETLELFYRKDLLAKAGFDKPPATWEDFVKVANALTGPGAYGTGLFGGWGAFQFYPWLWQAGAEMLNNDGTKAVFNSPEAVKALQLWVDLQKTVMPPGMATATEDDVKGLFITGSLAMFTSGPWVIPSLKSAGIDGKWAIAPLPSGAQSATVLGGWDLLVLKNSKHPDQAKAFLSWLMQDKNIRDYYLALGSLPVKTALAHDPAFTNDPYISEQAAILGQPGQARSRPSGAAAGDVDAALGKAMQAALAGTLSPQQALDTAVEEANAALSGK